MSLLSPEAQLLRDLRNALPQVGGPMQADYLFKQLTPIQIKAIAKVLATIHNAPPGVRDTVAATFINFAETVTKESDFQYHQLAAARAILDEELTPNPSWGDLDDLL